MSNWSISALLLLLLLWQPVDRLLAAEQFGMSAGEAALLEEARTALDGEQPLQSLRMLDQIIGNPETFGIQARGMAHLEKGKLYLSEKSPEFALKHFTEALRLFEATGDGVQQRLVHLETGAVLQTLADPREALAHFEAALELDNSETAAAANAELHLIIGTLHRDLGEITAAEAALENAVVHFEQSGNNGSWNDCARVLLTIHETNETYTLGAKMAQECLVRNTEAGRYADAFDFATELARFQERMGRISEAIEAQRHAVELALLEGLPEAWRAHARLGELYAELHQDKAAMQSFAEALRLTSASNRISHREELARMLASYHQDRQEFEQAFAYLSFADSAMMAMGIQSSNLKPTQAIHPSDLNTVQTEIPFMHVPWYRQWGAWGVVATLFFAALGTTFWIKRTYNKRARLLNYRLHKRTAELHTAQEDLNTYIYRSSHDLRNPLVSAQGLLRLLRAEDHSQNTLKCLRMIEGSVNQMDQILIGLSKALDYRKRDVKVERIDLHKMREFVEGQTIQAPGGMEIIWDIRETAPFYSDPAMIQVILQNTIENAIQFRNGAPDDYCKISLATDGKGAHIRVEDNGVGITEQAKDTVFGMFVKGSTQSKGSGLGLYLVRLACDKIRARIDLQSRENEGSALTFNLPNLVRSEDG